MGKRLELVWPNKEKVLLSVDKDGKPVWGTKADIESRLLIQLESVGKTSPDNRSNLYKQSDNLLIKGDNLLALKSLERHFSGRIKCIYIDPPFNTGNAFEHYDDGLEHTIWLSMMKARLEILKKLLREDGAIFVHIDDNQVAPLKVLLDEIFSRRNFINQIAIDTRAPSSWKTVNPGVFETAEYILSYAKDKPKWKYNPQFVECEYDQNYNLFIPNRDEVYSKWRIKKLADIVAKEHGFNSAVEAKKKVGKYGFIAYLAEFAVKNADRVFRFTEISDTGAGKDTVATKNESLKNPIKVFRVERVDYNDRFIYNGKEITFYAKKVRQIDGEMVSTKPLTNIWTDISWEGIANEGAVEMKKGKKPEALLRRVIDMSTSPGDYILDSFLGSGTTAAVAQKMGRKWIGIEIGEHAETLCLPRLKRVVSGEDQTGISKSVNWKGGGGFRYCVLGESLFARDKETGLVMINPKYTNGLLVNAVCNLEDFRLNNHKLWNGVRGNTYAHITEEKVTSSYLKILLERLPDKKNLMVYCLKRANDIRIPENVKIKRIPKELQAPRYLTTD